MHFGVNLLNQRFLATTAQNLKKNNNFYRKRIRNCHFAIDPIEKKRKNTKLKATNRGQGPNSRPNVIQWENEYFCTRFSRNLGVSQMRHILPAEDICKVYSWFQYERKKAT